MERNGTGQLRVPRRARWRTRGLRPDIRKEIRAGAGVRDADRSLPGYSRLVLGEHDRPRGDGDAEERRLLQPRARVQEQSADEEQDVSVGGYKDYHVSGLRRGPGVRRELEGSG